MVGTGVIVRGVWSEEGALLPKGLLAVLKIAFGLSMAGMFVSEAYSELPYGSTLSAISYIGLGSAWIGVSADQCWAARKALQDPKFTDPKRRFESGMKPDSSGLWLDDWLMYRAILFGVFAVLGVVWIIQGVWCLAAAN